MIKINLLKNVGLTPGVTGSSDAPASPASVSARNQAGVRILAILSVPLLLYIYDNFANSALEKELADTKATLEKVQADKAKYGNVGVKMEQYTKEKKLIDEQVEIIRSIARTRLREVKSLDAIQSLVPQKTWLNKVSIQNGTIRVTGYTNSEDGIPELIRGLENSAFFSHVDPKSTNEEKIGAVTVKKFELEFKAGKQAQE